MTATVVRKTDEEIMADAVSHWLLGYSEMPITSVEAKVIASQWHGGQSSALYSLASCGAVSDDLAREVQYEINLPHDRNPWELLALRDYVNFYGVRGPVAGWANLHWGFIDNPRPVADYLEEPFPRKPKRTEPGN